MTQKDDSRAIIIGAGLVELSYSGSFSPELGQESQRAEFHPVNPNTFRLASHIGGRFELPVTALFAVLQMTSGRARPTRENR